MSHRPAEPTTTEDRTATPSRPGGPRTRSPIRPLPPEVAELIAAGEVIERPAAVVRELVDNALDAGAGEIEVRLRGGGLRLIQVSDDGCGIPADEVELAFARYATSKLRRADDLWAVTTLGFRGEALAAIAAVADVTLVSATEGSGAVAVTVRSGAVVARSAAARARGTTVQVRDLFQGVPARLKFVGDARGESAAVGRLLRRYALAYPEVRFLLVLDGHVSLRTSGQGDPRVALAEVYGPALAPSFVPLGPVEVAGVRVHGYLAARALAPTNRGQQALFVNRRPVAVRPVLAALEAGYRPRVPRGQHPIVVLFLDVPPGAVDVNVHPAKQEVKLVAEAEVCAAVQQLVADAFGQSAAALADAEPLGHPNATGVTLGTPLALQPRQAQLPEPTRRLAEPRPSWGDQKLELGELRALAQVRDALVVVEGAGGLLLVDQHRAHERVLYEALAPSERREVPGQLLLEPVVIELRPRQVELIEARQAALAALGFRCERFGRTSVLVRSAPELPDLLSGLPDLTLPLAAAAAEADDWRHRLAAAVACHGAIRRGKPLPLATLERVLRRWATTASPLVCPHGSPVVLRLDDARLRRQFNW